MRKQSVVVNSTPIIALREIGQLNILEKLYQTVFVPVAVQKEVTAKETHALDAYAWILVKPVVNIAAKEAFTTALHDGEVETMLLAKEIAADLIVMDDGLAKKHAKYLNLTVTGTVGVLLRAKHTGIVEEIRPLLERLIRTGFYVSDSVCREVLRLANELTDKEQSV
jgi:predicted nucleic acid-binding protein